MSKTFTHAEYNKMLDETFSTIRELSTKKGGEYAGDTDRLLNFRRNADAAGTTKELIWRVYVSKHWDAIMQYEQDIRNGKTRDRLESLESRVDDIIVYMLLFKAMLRENSRPE